MAFRKLGLSDAQIASDSMLSSIADIYDRVRDPDSDHNLRFGIGCTGISGPTGAFVAGRENYYYNNSCIVGQFNTGSSGTCQFGMNQDARGMTGGVLLGVGCVGIPSGATGAGSPYLAIGSNFVNPAQWSVSTDFTATNDATAVKIPIVVNGVLYSIAGRLGW